MRYRVNTQLTALVLFFACTVLVASPLHGIDLDEDPFLWLEEIEGFEALRWVQNQNERTLQRLSAHPFFESIQSRALEILNSDERIPMPRIMGNYLYNFWQDTAHPRGIYRRTTWDSYLTGSPQWETVLDIDALAREEGVNWAFAGINCLTPEFQRCLVRLSRGGADAVEVREFDMQSKSFLAEGFFLPEAKQSVEWFDENTLLVATDFGEGSLTTSGYARIAKKWSRGTELSEAVTLFEGEVTDVSVSVGSYDTADRSIPFVRHRPSFFVGRTYILHEDTLLALDIPQDASPTLVGEQFVVRLRSPWEVDGQTYGEGTLISIHLEDFLNGQRNFQIVMQTGERSTIRGVGATRNTLLVNLLTNVQAELRRYTFTNGTWSYDRIEAPQHNTVSFAATSPSTDRFFFTSSGFLNPTRLYMADQDGTAQLVMSMPHKFSTEGLIVDQREAVSRDGTRVPYFVVYRNDIRLDGTNPTLLHAYGGFEISRTPTYDATLGAAWLEKGGVYVLANIRGGGEFGPEWHRAAQRENRQRAFDDFIAVAEALIDQGITTPARLGIQGGSNGGLLVGAVVTQRPDLFGAVVCSVPLLDMRRYHLLLAGASWMAEYGNPDDPDDWAFIQKYSPYHNLRENQNYPRVLFTTTTRDDRVHPGHARKMAAKMEAMGHEIFYFENTEGGHGAGVTNEQRALMSAVTYTYLWHELALERPEARAE